MTEEEAKKKWCPFVRLTNDGSERVFNRWSHTPANDVPDVCCVGSACMAWHWDEAYSASMRQMSIPKSQYELHGYCGLAGKP